MLGRRTFLQVAGSAFASLAGCGASEQRTPDDACNPCNADALTAAPRDAYNILFVCVDQMRSLDLLPSRTTLPAIEQLAARGLTFRKHQITAAPCTPSRSVLYTGQHAPRTRMIDNINFPYISDMAPELQTIGTMLRNAGYYTAYKGKWHLSEISSEQCPSTRALEAYGFSDYNDCGDVHGSPQSGYRDDGTTATAAANWLRTRAPMLGTQPWFLAVNFVNPHDIMFVDTDGIGLRGGTQRSSTVIPILPVPRAGVYAVDRGVSLPSTLRQGFADRPAAHAEIDRIYKYAFGDIPTDREDLWREYLNYYVNCQLDVANHVQTVLDALAAAGLRDKTIVVFTADHGELGGAHGSRQKGCFLYRENNHVPLLIAHPAFAGGTSTDALSSVLDITPTLLGLAGVSASQRYPELRGHDLSSLLSTPSQQGPRANTGALYTYDALSTVDADWAIANTSPFGIVRQRTRTCSTGTPNTSKRGYFRGIYDGRYRFARYFAPSNYNRPNTYEALIAANEIELYDTMTDPEERTNLAAPSARESNRAVIEQLRGKLETLITAEIGADPAPPPAMLNPC